MHYILYLIVGSVAGTLAGLLGIGGGLIVVPALVFVLPLAGFHDEYVVHVAVATSLATVFITSSASTWAHHKRGAVRWDIVKRAAGLLAVGIVLGAFVAVYIPGDILARLIAIVIFLIAIKMFLKKSLAELNKEVAIVESRWRFVPLNILFGMLSAMFGVGGGTFIVPYLTARLNCTMQQAVATGSACAMVIGFVAVIMYMVMGVHIQNMPVGTTGYIYWPAWLGIVIASTLCAPLGVKLAHRLPAKWLRLIFACMLMIVAIKLFI